MRPVILSLLLLGSVLLALLGPNNTRSVVVRPEPVAEALPHAVADSSTMLGLSEGLVAHYSFDDGTAADRSGNGNDGTIHGATQISGVRGGALSFDGIDDYVQVPQSPTLLSLQQMTLAYWVKYYKPTSGPDNVSTTIANGPDAAPEYGFFSYAMHDRIRHHLGRWGDTTIAFADGPFDATIPLNQQNYVFVVFVVTDTKVLSYRNGYKQQENNRNGKPISRPSQDWYFAYSGAPSWPYFLNGHLDEIRIYNRALSPSEIDELYRQGFPGTLATPQPTSPERSATVELPVTLTWSSVENATRYEVQVSESEDFATPAFSQSTSETTMEVSGLSRNTMCYWRVRAVQEGEARAISEWSDARSFHTTEVNLNDGLVAYYSFDDGTAGDNSGNGNDGTIHDATRISGVRGGALSFDGIDDYVDVSDDDSLDLASTLTLATWASASDTTGVPRFIGKPRLGGGTGYALGLNGGKPSLNLNNGASWNCVLTAPQPMGMNQWTHVAGTYDGSVMRIYINGQRRSTDSTCARGSLQNSLEPLYIGREFVEEREGGRHFNGKLDEIRIYNRALTEAEIRALYQQVRRPVLTVDEIRAIQAVEGAPLVAGKRTAVLVRIGVDAVGPVTNVRVKLDFDGIEYTEFYPREGNLRVTDWGVQLAESTTSVDISPDQQSLDVYFFPPWEHAPGILTATVEADGVDSHQLTVSTQIVQPHWGGNSELRLAFIPIEKKFDEYDFSHNERLWLSFLRDTFPVAPTNVKAVRNHSPVTLSHLENQFCDRWALVCVIAGGDFTECRNKCLLTAYARNVRYEARVADDRVDRAIGVFPPGRLYELSGDGAIVVPKVPDVPLLDAAVSDDGRLPVPDSLAHELAHTYGLYTECEQYHDGCEEGISPPGKVVERGLDPTARVLKEHGLFGREVYDFMARGSVYNPPQVDFWVTKDTYEALLTKALQDTGLEDLQSRTQPAHPALLVSGLVSSDGELLLDPYYLIPSDRPDELSVDGDVLIQLLGSDDEVLYQAGFPSSTSFTGDLSPIGMIGLAAVVPYPTETRYVVISLFDEELDRRVVSPNPPAISALTLTERPEGEAVDVSWRASDTDGDPVKATILLSSDEQETWQTLAMNVEEASYSIDTSRFTASRYWIKLIGTDGVLTSTATAGPFKIVRKTHLPLVLR